MRFNIKTDKEAYLSQKKQQQTNHREGNKQKKNMLLCRLSFILVCTLIGNVLGDEITREIPQFVIDYSPMVYLYSEENFYPGNIKSYIPQLKLCIPSKNYNNVPGLENKIRELRKDDIAEEICIYQDEDNVLTPQNLTTFFDVDLKHNKDSNISQLWFEVNKENPEYQINSKYFVMTKKYFNPKSDFFKGHKPTNMGIAPHTPSNLVVTYHHKRDVLTNEYVIDYIDAFWGLFYPFNEGAYVMGTGPWGNHLGDWEHILVRFFRDRDTFKPVAIWLSAHSGGFAYEFDKISKYDSNLSPGKKPIVFSAKGTHANYASVGQHAHDVPFFFSALSDFTDRGMLWDVASNYYGYSLDLYNDKDTQREDYVFIPAGKREQDLGSGWLNYLGRWGNEKLPKTHPLQKNGYVQWRYIDGPTGPIGKRLDRERICEKDYVANNYIYWNWFHLGSKCHIRKTIKKGAGLDAERGEFVGDNCGCLLYKIKPVWLRRGLELVTWRGLLCYIMEFFTG